MANLRYFIREGARGFLQAKLMTFVSIMTIAVALFVASIATIAILNVKSFFETASEKGDFVVYLNDSAAADSASLGALAATLRTLPEAAGVVFIDKEAAWKRFAALYGKEMLAAVDNNPLPVSFELSLKKAFQSSDAVTALKNRLEAIAGVESVRYARDWMDFLSHFRWYFFTGALVIAAAMFVALHITITNSIKLTMYARRELIRNMHLVGATRFFVAMPFVIEGMLQGCIGGIIAMVAVFILEVSLHTLPINWGPLGLPALFLLLGVFFGWIGSITAVRKFTV
jgi:cell division transport system permease protein